MFTLSAPFFVDCISKQHLDEMNIEINRNTLYKAYLENFKKFCKDIGDHTADTMYEILAVRTIYPIFQHLQHKICDPVVSVFFLWIAVRGRQERHSTSKLYKNL